MSQRSSSYSPRATPVRVRVRVRVSLREAEEDLQIELEGRRRHCVTEGVGLVRRSLLRLSSGCREVRHGGEPGQAKKPSSRDLARGIAACTRSIPLAHLLLDHTLATHVRWKILERPPTALVATLVDITTTQFHICYRPAHCCAGRAMDCRAAPSGGAVRRDKQDDCRASEPIECGAHRRGRAEQQGWRTPLAFVPIPHEVSENAAQG